MNKVVLTHEKNHILDDQDQEWDTASHHSDPD